MLSFDRLAQVEMQLVMQHCDKATLLRLARCSRRTVAAASNPFAWISLSPLELQFKTPLEPPSRVSQSLLRHADLSVRWVMPPHADASHRSGAEGDSHAGQQQAAAETAALAALPGLRQLDAECSPSDLTLLCAALLARLDHGGALTSLRLSMLEYESQHADLRPLGQLVARSRTLTDLTTVGCLEAGAVRTLSDGVRQSTSLVVLRLCVSECGDEGASELAAAVADCRSLTELQLPRCALTPDGLDAMAAALCSNGSSVRKLGLRHNALLAGSATAWARLLGCDRCAIESLDLSHSTIGDHGAKTLAAALRANHTLTELQLSRCAMWTEGIVALAAVLRLNSSLPLRRLDLSHNQIDREGATWLAVFLRVNSPIEHLDLSDCELDDAVVAELAAGLPLAHSLRELLIPHNRVRVAGITVLAEGIAACPTLTLLDVSFNQTLKNSGMAALAPALGNLRTLDVSHCGVTHSSAQALASLLQSTHQLETLRLGYNGIGASGVTVMAASLNSATPLRTLDLSGCDLDAEGAAALGEALRRGWAVTDLQLASNWQLGDDGARSLASALEQTGARCSLHTLSLEDCNLALAGGLAMVRAALHVPTLRRLSLRFNRAIQADDEPVESAAREGEARFQLEL